MTIYDVQNAQKTPIWKQRIIECRSSGMSVKELCKERGLDFTTYYRWERKILTSIIPTEDMPGLPAPNLLPVAGPQNAIFK
ncbi:MAG: helix-turn-helix domain-containing protein [Clostridia bacterium]|nr:helix-turn-helix domain-containing protein [Clostridia bacterium]